MLILNTLVVLWVCFVHVVSMDKCAKVDITVQELRFAEPDNPLPPPAKSRMDESDSMCDRQIVRCPVCQEVPTWILAFKWDKLREKIKIWLIWINLAHLTSNHTTFWKLPMGLASWLTLSPGWQGWRTESLLLSSLLVFKRIDASQDCHLIRAYHNSYWREFFL